MKQNNELTGRSETRETAYGRRDMPIPSCSVCRKYLRIVSESCRHGSLPSGIPRALHQSKA